MSRKRVAILISGSGSNMVSLLDSMDEDQTAEPVLVVSNRADAGGIAKAKARGVAVDVVPSKGRERTEFEADLHRVLTTANIDIVCLAGFMRVLTAEFVSRWEGRILNIHPSLLPLFKGLDTHARALQAGVAVHGCTVHLVTPDLDDGPILGQAVVAVESGDTPETLAARVLKMEHRLYPEVLRRFAAGERAPLSLFP